MDNPKQIVFSGGGLRCFWQGGFMTVMDETNPLKPERVTGVSGGALAGSAWLAGCEQKLLDTMCDVFETKGSNVDLFHDGDKGITPHQSLYCEVVEQVLDAEAQAKVADGPAFQILIAHPPERPSARMTGAAMTVAYQAELHIVGSPHFNWAEKFGLSARLIDANAAARDGKLAELVCGAAVIPPVFEPAEWDGRSVIDAGMADQAPMPDPDDGDTLVLLTRRYKSLPDVDGRRYVMPSDETPADKIDFTDGQKLRDTWAQGESDARRFLDHEGHA
ncbi:MAG: phospholipase [Maritimibacter sp.]|nr:phospholipase [Maritimibacter sp.]